MTTPCFAVPGQTIIDTVADDGLTHIYKRTLADVQREYPDAVAMSVEEFCKGKAALQDADGTWEETTEEYFDEMLNVLPPAASVRGYSFFMVGEPYDHHALTGAPRFQAFKRNGDKFYRFTRPMTFREFKQVAGETARYSYVT